MNIILLIQQLHVAEQCSRLKFELECVKEFKHQPKPLFDTLKLNIAMLGELYIYSNLKIKD